MNVVLFTRILGLFFILRLHQHFRCVGDNESLISRVFGHKDQHGVNASSSTDIGVKMSNIPMGVFVSFSSNICYVCPHRSSRYIFVVEIFSCTNMVFSNGASLLIYCSFALFGGCDLPVALIR